MEFPIKVSGSAPWLYPADTMIGLLWYDKNEAIEIPKRYPYQGEWGGCTTTCLSLRELYPMPYKINIIWLSIVEKKFYALEELMPSKALGEIWGATEGIYSHIIVGMAPWGNLALWFYGNKKSILIAWLEAVEVNLDYKVFCPMSQFSTLREHCDFYINNSPDIKANIELNGLPSHDLFDNYMMQFIYRYQVFMEKWQGDNETVEWEQYKEDENNVPVFDWIEEALYDGTHDKLHDGGLMKLHKAGKPKKWTIQFHRGKAVYTAYFWFEDEKIREVFDRFYGLHPETKTDIIIRIDAEMNKYELALYRYGLKEPVIIKEDVYQLIVFKNKFEIYRSENYNQPAGAWIW